MSSIVIAGNTSGSITLQAPDAAGTTVLSLPTISGTVVSSDTLGNVGIGISSPGYKLHVRNDNTSATNWITSQNGTATGIYGTGYLGLVGTAGTNYFTLAQTGNGDTALFNAAAGALAFGTSNAERIRIDSAGLLLLGLTSGISGSSSYLTTLANGSLVFGVTVKNASASFTAFCNFLNNSNTVAGSITQATSTSVSFVASSDQRLKENIVDAPSALDSINAIKVRSFDWKADGTHQEYGYIAQELLKIAPEAVHAPDNADAMMGVDFGKLTPRIVKALQEQQAIIEQLKARLDVLENV